MLDDIWWYVGEREVGMGEGVDDADFNTTRFAHIIQTARLYNVCVAEMKLHAAWKMALLQGTMSLERQLKILSKAAFIKFVISVIS